MSVRYQNRIQLRRGSEFRVYAALARDAVPPEGGTPSIRLRQMKQSIVDAGGVWLNARTKCYAQKVHAREVRIDQQGVSFEFELVTVRAEISHAHAVARVAPGESARISRAYGSSPPANACVDNIKKRTKRTSSRIPRRSLAATKGDSGFESATGRIRRGEPDTSCKLPACCS